MKKFIAALALSLASVAAFALPAPQQIEQALARHDIATAQAMTQEVLAAKPNSARAHLLNANVLEQQGDMAGAQAELQNVRTLDRNGDVVNSNLYGKTVAELQTPAAAPVAQQVYAAPQPVVVVRQGWTLGQKVGFVLGVTFIVCFLVWLFGRRREVEVVYERQYVNNGRVYDAPPHPIPASQSGLVRRSSGGYVSAPVASTVVVDNGMNNMMTGMMLGEMMHHHGGYGYGGDVILDGGVMVDGGMVVDGGFASSAAIADTSYSSGYGSGGSSSYSSSSSGSSSYDDSNRYSSSSSSSSDYSSSYDSGSSFDSGSSGGSDW